MKNKIRSIQLASIIVIFIEVALLITSYFFISKYFLYVCLASLIIAFVLLALSLHSYKDLRDDIASTIGSKISNGVKEAFAITNNGVIVFDDEYRITYASSLFDNQKIIGEKVVKAIPGSEAIFTGSNKTVLKYNENIYELYKSMYSSMIYFTDITEVTAMGKAYRDEQIVIGLLNFDNYEESISFADEKKIAEINYSLKKPTIEYLQNYKAILRKIKEDRYIVIMNNVDFEQLLEDKFSILNRVHEVSNDLEVNITVSMAFSTGTADMFTLDEALNDTLELVLGRGGDQVGVKYQDKSVVFYGNSSDSISKISKVKARVIALSIKELITNCKNVVIVPHTNADFDAIGACIGVSKMVQAYGRSSYLLLDGIKIEAQARAAFLANSKELSDENIIDERAAIELLDQNTLVFVVDHHSYDQCAAPDLVRQANVVLIDHHRRKDENRIKAILVYDESSASSSVELVSELMQYQGTKIELNEIESTYMYTGLLVDTDNLTKRTSSRTFEACAYLKNNDANIALANEWLKESYDNFIAKTDFMRYSQELVGNIVVAAYPETEGMVEHTMCAIVASELIGVKDIEAAFTIALTGEDIISVSARSNGKVNVQIIMEKLGGGGHFNMAATKIKGSTVEKVKETVINAIVEYQLQGGNNESNLIK